MTAALLGLLLAQAGYYSQGEAQALFAQANDAYYKEDYASAEDAYQKLLSRGYGGADVLYNLGTSYLAQGELGPAVLYLERAKKLAGGAQDVDANLSIARSKQLDQVVGGQAEEPFVSRLVAATSDQVVGWMFLGAWVLGFGLVILFRSLPRGRRAWAAVFAALFLALSLPAGLVLWAHVYVRDTLREAVVLTKTAKARELPRDNGKVSFEVHAGLKVRVEEDAGKFVRIRLPNGLEGWTEAEAIAEI